MKRGVCAVGCVSMVMTLVGCGLDPVDLPIPGSYVAGEKYSVEIEFASVLNLPRKAKVVIDGVDAGVLEKVELVGTTAVATVDLSSAVQLPKGTQAELRQSTILGENYIALLPPTESADSADSSGTAESSGTEMSTEADFLADGDVIPIERTVPADNVEDVLRGLSNVVAGGHYVQLQEAVDNFNAAVPPDPAVLDSVNTAARAALTDLGDNTDEIDRILAAAEGVSTTIVERQSGVDRILTVGPSRASGLSEVLFSVVHLIFTLGYMSQNIGDVLAEPYDELHDAVGIIAPALVTIGSADSTVPMNVEKVNNLLRDRLIPYFQSTPNIALRSVSVEGATARADDMIEILRGIGIVR
ncbi:MlaD family protein [Rhodococcus sp. EPR-157]|uniref:MlaD family protein n=1 Tax=Rhodococcus sp. EPR-157 TaxID=1813677 RepID=UPI0008395D5B|nr:MlaD family protein [Rhodococcus sp. EPR-157]